MCNVVRPVLQGPRVVATCTVAIAAAVAAAAAAALLLTAKM